MATKQQLLQQIENRLRAASFLISQPHELYGANGGYSVRTTGHRDVFGLGQIPAARLAELVNAYVHGLDAGFTKGAASVALPTTGEG